ncbi:hypothetical protein NQF87_08460 [Bombella sp. TMW 2.2559]|uniref:Uncharacterized protein n=1 Tax=Bombella dulcis TaxID=2967339 RepID=A0ABT3WEA1_9PROT|nr:hypothetical protein [Bombella dulcis]MCX5616998.1 hypothetical protein [Bombella dulcis]
MSKTNAFTAITPEARLERLLSSCRLVQQNWDNLISALTIVEDSIPDRENAGVPLSGLVRLLINHQNEEYSDFVQEIRIAEGEAA